MMRKNLVREKLRGGEVVFGSMVLIPHPAVAEILGMAGFDFLMMDGEHGPLNEQLLENMVRACDSAGVVAMARLPVNDPCAMIPLLDTGILGCMVPHCKTRAEVERLVEGTKYAPIGKRGMTPGRVGCYGMIPIPEHIRQWNEEFMTIAMVEDIEAVHNLPEIMAVPGLDMLDLGPSDLANSMGYPGDPLHPEVQKTIAGILKQVRDAGRWVSMTPKTADPEEAKRYVDMGAQIIEYGDVPILRNGATALLKAAKAAIG